MQIATTTRPAQRQISAVRQPSLTNRSSPGGHQPQYRMPVARVANPQLAILRELRAPAVGVTVGVGTKDVNNSGGFFVIIIIITRVSRSL